MAFVTPTNVATGDVLTASRYNADVVANVLAGGPIYATEAARDAAIPSPFEGQRAYITGSTETSATGGALLIPTGIQTIYNGAVWVTVTPVGANTDIAGTTASAVYTTTLLSGGTNPSVTLRTGPTALVSVLSQLAGSTATLFRLSSSVTSTPTVAAGDKCTLTTSNINTDYLLSATYIMTVTAGLNTFALTYMAGSGTGTYKNRYITVQGIA